MIVVYFEEKCGNSFVNLKKCVLLYKQYFQRITNS